MNGRPEARFSSIHSSDYDGEDGTESKGEGIRFELASPSATTSDHESTRSQEICNASDLELSPKTGNYHSVHTPEALQHSNDFDLMPAIAVQAANDPAPGESRKASRFQFNCGNLCCRSPSSDSE